MIESETLDDELAAIRDVADVLSGLDEAVARRVVAYIADRYGVTLGATPRTKDTLGVVGSSSPAHNGFADVADLFTAAQPERGPEKALVVAFWVQVCEGKDSWPSQAVNDELKNLGHGLSNVTDTLTSLISKKPQLVIQLRKSGTSKQARKLYKLTNAGITRVKELLATASTEEE